MSAAMKKVPSIRLPAQCRPITPKLGTSALTRPNHQSPSFLLSLLNCIVSQRRGGGGGSRWCYQCISQIPVGQAAVNATSHPISTARCSTWQQIRNCSDLRSTQYVPGKNMFSKPAVPISIYHGPSASGVPGEPSRVGPTNNPGGVPGASSPLTGGLASTCSAIIVKIVWTTRNNCPVAICRKVATGMPPSDIRGGSVRQSRSVVKPDVFRSHH